MADRRMPIEVESPEALGDERIRHDLAESEGLARWLAAVSETAASADSRGLAC